MTQPIIKLYGERNTGTNYLARLLHLNFAVDLLPGSASRRTARLQRVLPGKDWVKDLYFLATYSRNLGWKHTAVKSPEKLERYPVCSDSIGFVTLTKNPYSWLLSLHNRPQHQMHKARLPFEEFLTAPWQTVLRENSPRSLPHPVELWNLKNRSYLQLDGWRPIVHLRYEDLLGDPAAATAHIAQTFMIPWNPSSFRNLVQSTKDPEKTFETYQSYYLEEQWRAKLTPDAVALINARLDHDLVSQFGYSLLPSMPELL